ncbi:GGDEF domain-containing protein [Luteimonas rhizosphaerae]|uniref:GGDEF domain-containing protein n=1 Tax=Luteimonas sp. 4-12 TaxID=2027406 RepID=UPI00117C3323|nr:diguanylate cyclase [Luteimonas sp. 4-12]
MTTQETSAGPPSGGPDGASVRLPAMAPPLSDILARVSREALESDNLDEMLQRIVDVLAAELPVTIASILLLDEAGGVFVQEISAGGLAFDPPLAWPWPVTQGVAGRCVRLGTPQLITDVAADPDYVSGHGALRAEYVVPIRHRSRLHGVLNVESVDAGFFDAAMCTTFDAVAAQIAGAIHLARRAASLERANVRLQRISMVDGLTGIANRRAFDSALDALWQRQRRATQPLTLLLVDADHFKALNDALGHLRGDECLCEIAGVCASSAAAAGGTAARFGGEEFALLLPGYDASDAVASGEALRQEIEALALPHPASPVAPVVTVSLGGGTLSPHAGDTPRDLLDIADRALYAAKAAGRNRVLVETGLAAAQAPTR